MPKIHRGRGVTTEGIPAPTDPGPVEVLTDTDPEPLADPGELVDAIVVDEHGDDAAAVEAAPEPAPARRRGGR